MRRNTSDITTVDAIIQAQEHEKPTHTFPEAGKPYCNWLWEIHYAETYNKDFQITLIMFKDLEMDVDKGLNEYCENIINWNTKNT